MTTSDSYSFQRQSDLSRRPFPFEVVHAEGPVVSMEMFHWHDYLEISLVRRGSGVYEIEDRMFPVRPGDLVIVNGTERHRVRFEDSDPLYETSIHFDPRLLWSKGDLPFDFELARLFGKGVGFVNLPSFDESGVLYHLYAEIVEEYLRIAPFHEIVIQAKLLLFVAELLRAKATFSLGERQENRRRSNIERLERILAFLEANQQGELTLRSVAERFFMNPTYFSEYFKKNVGVGFAEYLARMRIETAIRKLAEGRSTLTEIALQCGFNSLSSFYGAFRRIVGMNPSAFLKSR